LAFYVFEDRDGTNVVILHLAHLYLRVYCEKLLSAFAAERNMDNMWGFVGIWIRGLVWSVLFT